MIDRDVYISALKKQCTIRGKCFLWNGETRESKGATYGYFAQTLVHELMWMLSYGRKFNRNDYFINHKCRNRLCINPDHLELKPNENSKKIVRSLKKIFGDEFYNISNDIWSPPKKAEANPSKFAEWIYSCEVGDSKSPPLHIRRELQQQGKKYHLDLETIKRRNWFRDGMLKNNQNWSLYYAETTDSEKNFVASKLRIDNRNFICRPDLVLRNEASNEFIIIERKFTNVPSDKLLRVKWLAAQGQLWCYSWIDDFLDASQVQLILEFYYPPIGNKFTRIKESLYLTPLPIAPLMWSREDQDFHQNCLSMFEKYGGKFQY